MVVTDTINQVTYFFLCAHEQYARVDKLPFERKILQCLA
jgi:hypothetical protein